MEKRKKAKSRALPSTLDYWNGWAVIRASDGLTLATFKGTSIFHLSIPKGSALAIFKDEDASISTKKEKDPLKHQERISKGDIDYICDLIEESPLNFDDPVIKLWLPIYIRRLSLSSANANARIRSDRLFKSLKKDMRGLTSPTELKRLIERDIKTFKDILSKRNKEKSLGEICLESDGISDNRMWQIYKAYKKVMDIWFSAVSKNEDEFFFFLNLCKERVDQPVAISFTEKYIFCKGQVKDDTFQMSW